MNNTSLNFFILSSTLPRLRLIGLLCGLACGVLCTKVTAMGLSLQASNAYCAAHDTITPNGLAALSATAAVPPAAAAQRLRNSSVAKGSNHIAWAWLASPTVRYPHQSLGSVSHAGSAHVLLRNMSGELTQLNYELPFNRVFEDLLPRLIDLDNDGKDELVLVESSIEGGASLVVLGVQHTPNGTPVLQERAKSSSIGRYFRWLNPVGAADFDGDGKLDLAAVVTPHIGGVLTLYHYAPPQLLAFARLTDVSNHRMGSPEQRMAVIVPPASGRKAPTIIVADMMLQALQAVMLTPSGAWKEMDLPKALPAKLNLLLSTQSGACAKLSDHSWWFVTLT